MLQKNCQVCGNAMFSQTYCGTNVDGTRNLDFCSDCYRGGCFYSKDWDGTLNWPNSPWAMSLYGFGSAYGNVGWSGLM